jgi:carboxyl-terminal processing protease
VVIGERSYGKGTVQNVIDLPGREGMLKLTTAGYLRPNGKNIHRRHDAKETDEWGVSPNAGFVVKQSTDEEKKWMEWRRDRDIVRPHGEHDAEADDNGKTQEALKHDAPLQRAIEYIDSQLKSPAKSPAAADVNSLSLGRGLG